MSEKPLIRLLVGLVLVLGLVIIVLVTPLGTWLGEGATRLWEGFMRWPGMALVRQQMGSPAPVSTRGANGAAVVASEGSDEIRALLQAGFELQQNGSVAEALKRYREALAQDPNYPPTHVALAQAYAELGREAEAVQELEQASALAPDNAYVWRQLGSLYMSQQDWEAAVQAFTKARALAPEDALTRYGLGVARYSRSYADTEAAVVELEKAAELAPEDPDMYFNLALAYAHRDQNDDNDKAIQAFEKVLQLDASQTRAYYYLGQLYMQAGRREDAIRVWQKFVAESDDRERVAQVQGWLRNLGP